MQTHLSIILLVILLASCSTTPDTHLYKGVDIFCDLLSNNVDSEVSELLETFGEPDQISVQYYPNKHLDNVIDEVHTGSYLDGKVQVYSATGINRNYLMRIIFTEMFWRHGVPMQIGKDLAEIVEDFGAPQDITNDVFIYHCGEGEYDLVKFHFNNAKVDKMEVVAWID